MSAPVLMERLAAASREVVPGEGGELLDVTGYLDDAVQLTGLMANYLAGRISSDLHRRYPDGYRIHTSYVVKELEKDVFLTRSRNVYRVRSWRPETQAPEFGG